MTPRRCWAKELNTTPAYARRAVDDALRLKLAPDGLVASEAGMRRVFTTLQRAGLVPTGATFDMARFVDGHYGTDKGEPLCGHAGVMPGIRVLMPDVSKMLYGVARTT